MDSNFVLSLLILNAKPINPLAYASALGRSRLSSTGRAGLGFDFSGKPTQPVTQPATEGAAPESAVPESAAPESKGNRIEYSNS